MILVPVNSEDPGRIGKAQFRSHSLRKTLKRNTLFAFT